mgnify:CR=1 FL=1
MNNNIYEFIEKNWRDHEVISEKYKNIPKEDLSDYEKGLFCFLGILGFTKDSNKAEEHYLKALLLEPNNKHIYSFLGLLYNDEEKYNEAEECCLKALEIDPKYIDVLYNLGYTYYSQKKYDKAEEYWSKVIEIDVNYELIVSYFEMLFREQGKPDKLEELLLKVLEIDINHKRALMNLNNLYMYQRREFNLECIKNTIRCNKLEKRVKQLEDELNYYALHEAYKPDGIIAEKIKEHFEEIYKT